MFILFCLLHHTPPAEVETSPFADVFFMCFSRVLCFFHVSFCCDRTFGRSTSSGRPRTLTAGSAAAAGATSTSCRPFCWRRRRTFQRSSKRWVSPTERDWCACCTFNRPFCARIAGRSVERCATRALIVLRTFAALATEGWAEFSVLTSYIYRYVHVE